MVAHMGFCHGVCVRMRSPETQPASSIEHAQGRRREGLERFLFEGFLSHAHRPDFSGQPPWDISFPGWQRLNFVRCTPDALTTLAHTKKTTSP